MYAPYDQMTIDHASADVTFAGLASKPNASIRVEVYDLVSRRFVLLATATAEGAPILAENTFGGNPALYAWSVSAPIAQPSNRDQALRRWEPVPCEDTIVRPADGDTGASSSPLCAALYRAQLQAKEVGGDLETLMTFPRTGISCVSTKVGNGANFFAASVACQSSRSPLAEVFTEHLR
jgi:hypothetical protein